MLRFILFVIVAWFVGKLVSMVLRTFASRHEKSARPENNFAEAKPNAQMDFKDVQDADFVDISAQSKEKAPK